MHSDRSKSKKGSKKRLDEDSSSQVKILNDRKIKVSADNKLKMKVKSDPHDCYSSPYKKYSLKKNFDTHKSQSSKRNDDQRQKGGSMLQYYNSVDAFNINNNMDKYIKLNLANQIHQRKSNLKSSKQMLKMLK